jgi:outer membrane PBP1 activator LpoA protein
MEGSLTVLLLENKHGSQSNGLSATSAGKDSELLQGLDQSSGIDGIKGNVRALRMSVKDPDNQSVGLLDSLPLALSTEVEDEVRVLLSELLHLGVQDISHASLALVSKESARSERTSHLHIAPQGPSRESR